MTEPAVGGDRRHINLDTLDTYWGAAREVQLSVDGTPPVALRIDPLRRELGLITRWLGDEPDISRFANLLLRPFVRDGEEWCELRIAVGDGPRAAFAFLSGVADRLQTAGQSLSDAIAESLAEHRGVLASRPALSREQEIGLFGELLIVEHLVLTGRSTTIERVWQGPSNEEHDFVFPKGHVEVKTTTSERRLHLINRIEQLVPVPEVPLWLLSIQLTRDGANGRTLSQLVREVRAGVGPHRRLLNSGLENAGWDDELSEVYDTPWAVRAAPRAFLVDNLFPAITPRMLDKVVPSVECISDVGYRINLTNWPAGIPPEEVAGFVERFDTEV